MGDTIETLDVRGGQILEAFDFRAGANQTTDEEEEANPGNSKHI